MARDSRATDLLRPAFVAVLVAVLLVLLNVGQTGSTLLNLVQPGEQGPAAEIFREDFPGHELLDDTGLDGQQFYVVARNPFDLDQAAEHVDRPRYRLQRPLLSWLAWLGHPTGGGAGLIVSLFVVNVLATGLLAYTTAWLSRDLGGPTWVGALVGLYPGVWWSLRTTAADALAVALALTAIALWRSGRVKWSATSGVGAVLARETAILVLAGWALRRPLELRRWVPAVAAGVVAGAWAVFLRFRLPGDESIGELVLPLTGFWDAITGRWLEGDELWGLVGAVVGVGAGVAALVRRGLGHALAPAMLVQLAFLLFANGDVIGGDFGSGRSTLALLALATIAFFAPGADAAATADARPTVAAAGSAPR